MSQTQKTTVEYQIDSKDCSKMITDCMIEKLVSFRFEVKDENHFIITSDYNECVESFIKKCLEYMR